jgi:tetratricopeptide (TPR) repeat protein
MFARVYFGLKNVCFMQLRNYDMCIAKNEEAIAIDPRFAECYGNMANAWKEKGDIERATRYYLTAIQLRPNFCDAWSNLASAYTRKGRLTEAAQCCRQALALNPRLVDAQSNLGNVMKAQGLIQEAYNCYLEALRIDPTFAIAWSNLAGLFMERGDLNRALIYYKVIFCLSYLSHISSKDIIPNNAPLHKYLLVLPSQRLILYESRYSYFFVCFALLLSSCLIGLIISQFRFSCT